MIVTIGETVIRRINKACRYFPCHKNLEDCTFCYCPFYPCADEKLGQYVYSRKLEKNIWSCKDCTWIHARKTVDRIYKLIRTNKEDLRRDTPLLLARRKEFLRDKPGIIILGHGSRLKEANALIPKIIKELKARLELKNVFPAYLQLAAPGLSKVIGNLAGKRCKKIIIVPFFLFVGNHVTRDIPEILEEEKAKYPRIEFLYTKNLGDDARVVDIVIDNILGKEIL
ncbi:MAG TPA: hypothetical protein DCL49_07860 [Candidatus Omnitrophica bacterium]|nr:hypothetical protein [Candidatus Omnitrophota bacterium]HBG64466.1 hypothetical protein [Candidatus Omnitrophota bacterium]HCD38988.1 hypothetical protein [Candidatus Omnitrophota bacterium]